MKTRRNRIDSTTQAIRIMSSAAKVIEPPETMPLDGDDRLIFDKIINEFPKADWTAHQLEIAALLAMSVVDMNREMRALRDEGAVVTGGNGGPVPNPRKQVVQMHANNIVSFRRSLALHAAAQGQKADAAKRIAMGKAIEAQSPFDDDLIARPN